MEASLSEIYSNMRDQFEERANSSDHSGDNSPSSTNFGTSISSPKRSRRTIQKRVVTTPLKDVEGPRFKGDCAPPSDSWAWRKYGQKPIKGSPYPRGYYRCSSSKGCPARKQVERSRSDPKMLVVTYSYEHNHPWPTSRNHHHNRHNPAATAAIKPSASSTTTATAAVSPCTVLTQHTPSIFTPIKVENKNHDYTNTNINIVSNNDQTMLFQHNHMNHYQEPLMGPTDELTWLSSDNSTFENNSFFSNCIFNDLDMSKIFSREEEESLFADLGELPECTVGFREATVEETEEQQQCNLAPWCGTMG